MPSMGERTPVPPLSLAGAASVLVAPPSRRLAAAAGRTVALERERSGSPTMSRLEGGGTGGRL
ncbi:MAG TPA: hypothetical protein VH599_11865 [Ktedonobacterales bacterium]